jgi:hypothetical protein
MATQTGIGTWCLHFTLPRWNRVISLVLVLALSATSLSLSQATHRSFHGLSHDELIQVEKAAANGLPPSLATPSTIDMPIDHFNESDHRTYKNRYWINATYYKEGGPVFL